MYLYLSSMFHLLYLEFSWLLVGAMRPCRLYWIMYGWCEEWKCYRPLPSVWTRLTTRDWHIGMFLSNKFISTSMGTKWFNIWTHLSRPTWNRIHSTSTPSHPWPQSCHVFFKWFTIVNPWNQAHFGSESWQLIETQQFSKSIQWKVPKPILRRSS